MASFLPGFAAKNRCSRNVDNLAFYEFLACAEELLSMKIVDFLDWPAWAIILGFKECPWGKPDCAVGRSPCWQNGGYSSAE
jgi:hypothetical protein